MRAPKEKNRGLYLVTGATGNVGRYFIHELLEKGKYVVAHGVLEKPDTLNCHSLLNKNGCI